MNDFNGKFPTILLFAILGVSCQSIANNNATQTQSPFLAPTSEEKKQINIQQEIALLRTEIQSLKESLDTLRQQLESIKQGIRSGIFPEQTTRPEIPSKISQESNFPSPMDLPPAFKDTKTLVSQKNDLNSATQSPTDFIKKAEIFLQRKQYGEAIVVLTDLQKTYPDYNDNGYWPYLLAQAWNSVYEFENALLTLRFLYQKYPTSAFFLDAKLEEARAYEGLRETEKAIKTCTEIISKAPQSPQAERARATLQKLRDKR